MNRYIDADALIQDLVNNREFYPAIVKRAIENAPTADVVEVRHGEWEVCSDEYEICASEFVCSICKESFCSSELTDEQYFEMMKYCPNCGAKMDGERREENGK